MRASATASSWGAFRCENMQRGAMNACFAALAAVGAGRRNPLTVRNKAAPCEAVRLGAESTPRGIGRPAISSKKTRNSSQSGAPGGAPPAGTTDTDLAYLAAAWPKLPEAVRQRLLGLAEGALLRE